ncbi:MAG: hypothetical protein QOF58_3083 [Pseudonocardiales bacterium]|jgi:hypothetical protein|nr:hypothetical protein [Pseudonocardiales bacterium]
MSGRLKLMLAVVAIAIVAVTGAYTWARFVATTGNGNNSIASGTVNISDNDTGNSVVALTNATPGASNSGCIKVSYQGTLASGVRLYGTTTGSGLDQYLDLTVTRGAYSPSDPVIGSCTNFQPDSTDYIGAGAGVIYNGTLQGFPDTWAAGLVDANTGSPEVWNTGEAHVYRFQVTLQDNVGAEGLTSTQAFTWEARNQ